MGPRKFEEVGGWNEWGSEKSEFGKFDDDVENKELFLSDYFKNLLCFFFLSTKF